jgi:hypothetical protein
MLQVRTVAHLQTLVDQALSPAMSCQECSFTAFLRDSPGFFTGWICRISHRPVCMESSTYIFKGIEYFLYRTRLCLQIPKHFWHDGGTRITSCEFLKFLSLAGWNAFEVRAFQATKQFEGFQQFSHTIGP